MKSGNWRRAAVMLGTIIIMAAPASTQERARKNAVSGLEPGLWVVRDLDNPAARPQSICVADPRLLLQLEHRTSPCSRVVTAADQNSVTVHYTCPSDRYGLTEIKVMSAQSAKIDTQGIKDHRPFQYRAEARRVRGC